MHYIIFDLEWNQGNEQIEKQQKEIPFEVIEIGAVRMNSQMEICGSFHEVIRPQVYRGLHYMTRKLLGIDMKELAAGRPFPEVMEQFLAWCGGEEGAEYRFGTWGPQDLTELQRNMRHYGMPPLSEGPLKFYDVQKLFSIAYEDKKSRRNLEYAADFLKIDKNVPFHRALSDAYYTAMIFAQIRDPQVLAKVSFDVFCTPRDRKGEVHIVFDDYAKYISREFEDKTQLLADREVTSTRCYLCRRNLKRKVKWFTPNGKHYYSVSLCPIHGYMKGKIRVRRSEEDGVYAVKTVKFISEEEALAIRQKRDRAGDGRHVKGKPAAARPAENEKKGPGDV